MALKRIAVFISGGGSNLQVLLDHIHGQFGEIVLVISSNPSAYGLKRAQKYNIDTFVINKSINGDDDKIIHMLEKNHIELIVLAGYLKIMSSTIVRVFENKIINIHPSLIPAFCGHGYYGLKVHEKVYEYGVKVTGATVHFVDEGTDTGPIIMQKPVIIDDDDNPENIQQKVLKVEHEILCKCVQLFCENKIFIHGRRVNILS